MTILPSDVVVSNAPPKLPWLKFFPADWRADPALRMCSLAARGLWMEMLALMHDAEPRGSLIVNGKPLSSTQLASLAGAPAKEVGRRIEELRAAGVFSVDDDGTIYSRRMRRDEAKAKKDRENGSRGGNPSLKPGVNPQDNAPVGEEDKAQSPESKVQSPESSSSDRTDDDAMIAELRRAAGPGRVGPDCTNLAPIKRLIADGVDFKRDVLPYFKKNVSKLKSPLRTFDAGWLLNEIRVTAEKRAHGEISAPPAPVTRRFVAVGSPEWEAVAASHLAKHRTRPPTRLNDGVEGWDFPVELLEGLAIGASR